VLKVGVRSNREQSSFPECSCGGSVEILTCGVVNVPEFLSKPAKLNSDQAPTEMLLAYERYAASLIFLSGHIHQNELLPRFDACSQGDKPTAEIHQMETRLFPKRLFVLPASVDQNR
jgi:hypothetical protein